MLKVIIGPSCSGKSTIFNKIRNLGEEVIISYTTRPMRENEKNGRDYYFISDVEYERMKDRGLLIARFEAENGWKYGLSVDSINFEREQYVILEPHGYQSVIKRFGKENIKSYLLNVPYEIRYERGKKRGDSDYELNRRFISDLHDFKDFKADFTIGKNWSQICGGLQDAK